jgi:hypothetical protein
MKSEVFSNISKIIERDSKSSTYKFALLRGVIDIILDNSPYITFTEGRVHIPTGLLVEKWLLYYYPILESTINIPQINGSTNLAFEVQFRKFIESYSENGGFSAFYNDLKNKGIPPYLQSDFIFLAIKIRETITRMPMRYIGRSISNDYYSIFQFTTGERIGCSTTVDLVFLINKLGTFSIPYDYYEAFQVLGSFINGQDSILFKWAEFSVNASGKRLTVERVVNEVLKSPITDRDVAESKQIYRSILKKEGSIYCVWTGKLISEYDIDHMIPFSVWKNNDLWNLLPSQKTTNGQKRDKIPSMDLIEKRKDLILYYWDLMDNHQPERFRKELQVSLLGTSSFTSWHSTAICQLQKSCDYLISNRGYEEWKI